MLTRQTVPLRLQVVRTTHIVTHLCRLVNDGLAHKVVTRVAKALLFSR